MDIIQELGTRKVLLRSGKYTYQKFCEFKCPNCSKIVERDKHSGSRNKSCGDPSCRKAMFRHNPECRGNTKDVKISDIEFYSAFKAKYSEVKKKYKVCAEWSTMQGFVDSMHSQYVQARAKSTKISFICDEATASPSNSYWKPVGVYSIFSTSTDKLKKYVYLVKAGEYFKIGITNRVGDRLAAIQTCNPIEVELLHTKEVTNAGIVEKELHTNYTDFAVRGEWFKLSEIHVAEIINYINSLK